MPVRTCDIYFSVADASSPSTFVARLEALGAFELDLHTDTHEHKVLREDTSAGFPWGHAFALHAIVHHGDPAVNLESVGGSGGGVV
jgi:hypothetical protein